MKLIRFGDKGKEKPGVMLAGGKMVDVSAFGADYDEGFFAADGVERLHSWLDDHLTGLPEVPAGVRLGPPVCRPSKIVCIGLNYRDHASEAGAKLPKEPVIFFKSTTAIVGPNDDLMLPKDSSKTDWEVELALVVGRKASYVPVEAAMPYLAGYMLHNDYSERAFQMERSGQWVKGKSCDTFAPVGPFLASKDEIHDVQNLAMWLKVNGTTRQDGSTADMIFPVPFLVSYLSQFMTLLPGDVISTGTPAGVGLGCNPPQYLKAGDVVELGIDGLGASRQKVVPYVGQA
jgi:2-keto-4-pentenoate hydratase/2-oxohepta-3-ene-1,7-dioic acid hydratase in catechol pathway